MYRPALPALVLSLAMLTACGGGDGDGNGGGTTPNTPPPQILSVSPDTLVEGQTAIITGLNFAASATGNFLLLNGVVTPITSATPTQVTFLVPAECGPIRIVTLQVSVNSVTSNTVSVPLRPDSDGQQLEPGEQLLLRSQTSYCINLPAGSGTARYLLGIQSTGENATIKRSVTVRGARGSAAAVAAQAARIPFEPSAEGRRDTQAMTRLLQDPQFQLARRHRDEHRTLMETLIAPVRDPMVRAGVTSLAQRGPARTIVDGSENLGDQVDFRVRRLGQATCGSEATSTVTAELKVKNQNTMWFVDVDNPAGGFTDEELQGLADLFDQTIFDAEIAEFGAVNDLDGNGRIVIVITKQLNIDNGTDGGTVGFVNPCDFVERGSQGGSGPIHTSNEGEFYYAIAPDPDGLVGQVTDNEFLLSFQPLVMAHEFVHIIQFSRRFAAGNDVMDIFMAEGQATIAEEIAGHAVLGFAPGQNLSIETAINIEDVLPFAWYLNPWADLIFFWGFPETPGAPRNAGAPQECTWIADVIDPCEARPSWYGVTWSFMRWVSDQFGDALGGEAAFQQALIDNSQTGFANLRSVLSAQGSLEELLAHWSAMLYLDDRPDAAVQPIHTMSSWDLYSADQRLVEIAWLRPPNKGFTNFSETVSIRDPSMAYFLIGGSNPPAYTIRVTSGNGGNLPTEMQVWLVRMQ